MKLSAIRSFCFAFLLPCLLLLGGGMSSHAASITWGAPVTISGDTDVATNGVLAYAYDDSGVAATVNTVPFAAANSGVSFGTNILAGFGNSTANAYVGGASTPWSGLSANYQTVLEGGAYTSTNSPAAITLYNLTVGHAYLVQVWVNDSRAGSTTNRTETVTGGSNTVTLAYNNSYAQGGVGQYTIGSFTADGATQTFTLNGILPSANNSSQLNAIQVRDQGAAPVSINWGAPATIFGEADVSTNGTLVYACDGQNAAATVNTVPFAGGFGADVSIGGSAGSVTSTFGGGTSTPWANLSTNYQTVLAGGVYANNNATQTVTLNNLTAGHPYLVQVWVNDSRSGNTTNRTESVASGSNTVTLAYNSTYAQGGVGQFTIGTFIATSTTQAFSLTGVLPSGNNSAQINALQVRDQTVVAVQFPAFPGAQGYGAGASGGRGGTVYHVTSLADSGAGTFRDAISQPNRTIVFDLGGTIVLQSRCYGVGNLTIAGQTAPGQGICIYSNSVYFDSTTNIILRHVRFRQGVNAGPTSWSLALLGLTNGIVDHCSIELGDWQTLAIQSQSVNVTVQNCIVGAALNTQLGSLVWTSPNVTFHHTLWLDDVGRDPKIDDQNAQIINDVVYNPQIGIYGDGTEQVDFIGNYHISGPSDPSSEGININNNGNYGGGAFYFSNNLLDQNVNGKLAGSPLVTNAVFDPVIVSATPFCNPTIPVTIDPPALAYYKVGSQAGCSLARDSVDNILIGQLLSLGKQGQTYTNESQLGSMTLPVATGPTDTDQDGMPDEWELATGSNYQVADNNVVAANGYTLLENFLNWMAAPHTKTCRNLTAPDFDLWPITVTFTNQSPVYALSNPTNGSVMLVSNRFARFAPGTNFFGLGSFTFTVQATDGTIMTNTVGVLVSPLSPPTNLVWRGDSYTNVWQLYTTNDWFNGIALQTFNGSDNVTFDDTGSNSLPVSIVGQLSPASLTVNATKNYLFGGGSLVGNMVLTKTNSGALTLAGTNSFSGGLVINGGLVVATNNTSAAGTGTIWLNGGNFWSGGIANPIANVGTNTWMITGPGNVEPSSTITGSGKLYLDPINAGALTPSGDWSGFTGTIALAGNSPAVRFLGTLGSAAATFDLGTNGGMIYNRNGGITVQLGAVTGGPSTFLSGAGSSTSLTTYVIGALNANSTFNGRITDGSSGSTAFIKVGTGTLTLTGICTNTGTTTISNGTLQVNGSLYTNTVTIAGGTLAGVGVINGLVSVIAGGTISPGTNNGTAGTLTVSNNLTLAAGSFSSFGLGTNSDRIVVKGNLALGGALNVINIGGLVAGTNTLFTYTGTLSGSLALGTMPAGFKFVLTTNVSGQVNLIVGKPVIATAATVSTNFILTGTGGLPTSNYYVLAATNLTVPITNWTHLATNQFDALGNFHWSNSVANPKPNQFYLIQFP